jgi:Tfp pilus assembly protein PilF
LQELQASDAEVGRLALRYATAPRDATLRHELAMWCLNNGEDAAGLRWLWNALAVDPNHAPTHAVLADHFERSGQPRRSAHHRRQTEARKAERAP